jgi:catechol 2,3-dioxygenase-like lactoylglutathione lyase family enzyme
MIRVPDVRATVDWYTNVGFQVVGTNENEGVIDWALLSFGDGRVMFNAGGQPGGAGRREVDLYVHVDDVRGLYERIQGSVTVEKGVHETFYGMRELIVRDLNGFWVTFGERSDGSQSDPAA